MPKKRYHETDEYAPTEREISEHDNQMQSRKKVAIYDKQEFYPIALLFLRRNVYDNNRYSNVINS